MIWDWNVLATVLAKYESLSLLPMGIPEGQCLQENLRTVEELKRGITTDVDL
jgi:hypothetical protein